MKRIITLLFAVALWLPASAQKDAAYWNKMADVCRRHSSPISGVLISRVILPVTTSTTAATSRI